MGSIRSFQRYSFCCLHVQGPKGLGYAPLETELADSDRLDAAIAVQAGLNELIDDSLVDKIRKIYKQLNNSHEKFVFTGGMHTAGSTRWGGTAERHDDQGNMCCPGCETDQYPSLSHVLWHCPFYDRHRTIAKPVCPLTCRLGWSHSTPATMSLRLVAQMGSTREAEVRPYATRTIATGPAGGCQDDVTLHQPRSRKY